jgi:hypothetical protein
VKKQAPRPRFKSVNLARGRLPTLPAVHIRVRERGGEPVLDVEAGRRAFAECEHGDASLLFDLIRLEGIPRNIRIRFIEVMRAASWTRKLRHRPPKLSALDKARARGLFTSIARGVYTIDRRRPALDIALEYVAEAFGVPVGTMRRYLQGLWTQARSSD